MLRLKMHKGIAQDERTLTQYQAQQLLNTLKRLQNGVTGFDDVEPLTGSLDGFYKIKPSAEARYNCNMNVRAVLRITDKAIEVFAVGARDSVYSIATNRVREQAYA